MTTFTTKFLFPKPGGTDSPDGATQIGALADAVDTSLAAAANVVNVIGAAPANDTTTSNTYSSLTSTNTSVSFTKKLASTAIRIDLHVTAGSSASATTMVIGVQINSVDYDVIQFKSDVANARFSLSGTAIVAAGLAAGTYTVQIRWKRTNGAGTVQRFISDDWQSMTVAEVIT